VTAAERGHDGGGQEHGQERTGACGQRVPSSSSRKASTAAAAYRQWAARQEPEADR
jgi:hypothetical protein